MIPDFPTSVILAGEPFDVAWAHLEEWGNMDFDGRRITLSQNRIGDNPTAEWTTLRHEMLHASLAMGGIAYSEKYEEEPVVRCLENIFFPAWSKLPSPI